MCFAWLQKHTSPWHQIASSAIILKQAKERETTIINQMSNDEVAEMLAPTYPKIKEGWIKYLRRAGGWMTHRNKDEWLKDMRGNLSLVATVISTMTFQMAFNPPGGVRSAIDTGGSDIGCDSDNHPLTVCPGEAVLAVVYLDDYFKFLSCNTICFVASLSVCLLLVSGIPLNHRFPMWLLSIGMCVTLTSLALTYITTMSMLTPDPVWGKAQAFQEKLIYTWVGLLSLLAFFLTLRFITWVVNLLGQRNKITKASTTPRNTREISSAPL